MEQHCQLFFNSNVFFVFFLLKKPREFWFPVWHVKSLEVITPTLTTRKRVKNWKSTPLLSSVRELRPLGKLSPSKLEKQTNTEDCNYWEQKQMPEPAENAQKITDIARHRMFPKSKNLWGPSLTGVLHTFMSYTSRSTAMFSRWRSEKNPLLFQSGGGYK